ncbi:MAG: hypothetical protein LEGION0398_MBIBDBAK_00236 [Legionellaceae bacterium]
MKKHIRHFIHRIITSSALLLLATRAFANPDTPINNSLLNVISDFLSSGVMISVATFVFMATGLLAIFNKIEWKMFLKVMIGSFIFFLSPSIVSCIAFIFR